MRSICTWAAACVLALGAPAAFASPLLMGATATATVSGPANAMLGADAGYAAGPGSNITLVTDDPLQQEFISDDFAIVVDIASNGRLTFSENSGTSAWMGVYEIVFSFSNAASFGSVVFDDLSQLASGSVTATMLSNASFRVVFDEVRFLGEFGSLGAAITAPAAVSAPGTLALAVLGLALCGLRRRSALAR